MRAGPGPIFGTLDEACPECIRFDVPQDSQQMPVVLNDEVLVSPLVDVSVAAGPIFRMVIAHMRIGQPTHEGRKFNA